MSLTPLQLNARQQGFALAATVWLLAIIAVAAGAFATWVSQSVTEAWTEREAVDTLIELRGTRDTVLFIAATQPMNMGGFVLPGKEEETAVRSLTERNNRDDPFTSSLAAPTGDELSLAGRPYLGLGNARFTLQDEAGLVNPNAQDRLRLDRLLGLLDVEPAKRGPLIDKLVDYISEGDLRSLHGARTADYLERDLPAPPDRYLLSGMEALRVLDWGEYEGIWQSARWRELVTVTEFGGINLNTAPRLVLQTDPFISEEIADILLQERQRQVFFSPEDAQRRTGLPLGSNIFAFSTAPSRHFRLTLWQQGANQGVRYHVRLTPQSEQGAPWELDHTYPVDNHGLSTNEPANTEDPIFAASTHSGSF
jgi:type II secretory pathway component PulK